MNEDEILEWLLKYHMSIREKIVEKHNEAMSEQKVALGESKLHEIGYRKGKVAAFHEILEMKDEKEGK